MRNKTLLRCPLTAILIFAVVSQTWSIGQSRSQAPYQSVPQINYDNILQHIQTLSSFGSRVTGYDGFYMAADYISDYWNSLNLTVRSESFNVASPIVERAFLTVQLPNGSRIELGVYPLWPNHVNPCPYQSPEEGDNLVYASEGLPEDFDGLTVEDSFVLMDFNNRWYWKNAAIFGAKGVIFLEPESTTCVEAVQKTLSIPLNFPRLYVRGENASLLRQLVAQQGQVKIWVDSRMVWKDKTVSNIIAVIEGSDSALKSEVVVIGAYYDSWSIVPQLSPGATDSMGIAFLLELSRLLTETKPARTVWLVAFAGHYQALAGAREFVDIHLNEVGSRKPIQMMFSFDLASDSDITAVYATGAMYQYERPAQFTRYYNTWISNMFDEWLPRIGRELGQESHFITTTWLKPSWVVGYVPYEPFPIYFEAEVFTEACYGAGLGFVTTNAFRIYQYTPFDTYGNIKSQNLKNQVFFLWPLLYNAINYFEKFQQLSPMREDRGDISDHGFVDMTIQLATYNRTTNWFNNYAHENAIFFISVGPRMVSPASLIVGQSAVTSAGTSRSARVLGTIAGVFSTAPVSTGGGGIISQGTLVSSIGFSVVMLPDAEGKVTIKGLRPKTGVDAQAYVLDPDDGSILCATDSGPFGTRLTTTGNPFGAASSTAAPTVSAGAVSSAYLIGAGSTARKAGANIAAYGYWQVPIINVSSVALLGFMNVWTVGEAQTLGIGVLNFLTHAYLIWRDYLEFSPEAMVFAEPGTIIEIVVSGGGGLVTVLNNASDAYPEGRGYKLVKGKTTVLTLFDAAKNMYHLANSRGGFLTSRMSMNAQLILYYNSMRNLKQLADEAYQNGQMGKYYSFTLEYWVYAANTYITTNSLIYDIVTTATFFFFLSTAFVIFMGKLALGRTTGIKKMIALVIFFIITNLALSLVHPGYSIASNVWMLIDGLAVILFFLLLLYIVIDEFNMAIATISQSVLGSHRSDIERGSLIISSLSMGVENLKKRPMRTGLTLTTIIITVSAMTLFTTMGVILQPYRESIGDAPYTGIIFRRDIAYAISGTISESYLLAVKDIVSEGLAEFQCNPRAWIYPAGQNMFISWNATTSAVRAILAITPEESRLLEGARIPGLGEPFEPGMKNAIIISDKLAQQLSGDLGINVTRGTKLNLWGINVTVWCIVSNDLGNAALSTDLDQSSLLPPQAFVAGSGVYSPYDLSSVIIVPYDFAKDYMNIQPNIISLKAESTTVDESALMERAFDLVLTLQNFVVSYGTQGRGNARQITTRSIYMLRGEENMIIPLFLSSLTLLSMMLSAVYERIREIRTLSTVGLSPRHIGAIFITESIALAFLGSFMGYFTGASVTALMWNLNVFPRDLIPNVSSGVVIIVMGIMMLATMLSSVYPVTKASKLVTPSLLRKWRIGSKPVGNLWSIGLPFSATTNEAIGVLGFLSEFFEASATERTGPFMLLRSSQLLHRGNERILNVRLQLSPFDAGIIQDFEVISRPVAADKYGFEILITRINGLESLWITTNKSLLDIIRKQFLIWRALRPSEQQKYVDRAMKTWRIGEA